MLPEPWTPERLRALGVRTDLVTACDAAYGAKRTKAYELFRRGELDFPAVRVGNRVVVPVASLCRFLGLELEPQTTHNSIGSTT
ncbi:hypothetical protein ASG41_13100 [Modestobacter sp. Leaf380]|nr:hypothetical protein ASG41_13100 [Modestobacter sp. Leaf380]